MIETERLKIIPLNYSRLKKFIACDNSLETEPGLKKAHRKIPGHLHNVIEKRILPVLKDKEIKNNLYNINWLVMSKQENAIVASYVFKGLPKEEKEIEIGNGTDSAFLNKGYMTEAISCAVKWAKEQNDVDYIIAETDPENILSIRVLEKNGFLEYKKIN